jgi:hypothetical protein
MTNLNRDGKIALSCNNESADAPRGRFIETWLEPLKFLDEIFIHALKAAEHRVYLHEDAYFFIVPKQDNVDTVFDFKLGDFECVEKVDVQSVLNLIKLAEDNLYQALEAVKGFLDGYLIQLPENSRYYSYISNKYSEYLGIVTKKYS